MTVDAVTLFFALLAVGAQLTVLGVAVLALGSRVSRRAGALLDALLDAIGPNAFVLALVAASVATAGSLYLSEVAHFVPCRLCWYQRFAMYPLVPLIAMSAWRRWEQMRWAVLAVAIVGGTVSAWHVLVERFPQLESGACDPTNPCSLIWVRRFGYLTIPTMALTAFALIATLMLCARGPRAE